MRTLDTPNFSHLHRRHDRICAIIAAAGRGERMGEKINKPFLTIQNKPIIVHTLEKFDQCSLIDCINIVVPEQWLVATADQVVDRFNISKVNKIVVGGKTRQQSVFSGLKAVDECFSHVVIHDAVRPFIEVELIDKVIRKGLETDAAILAVPVNDSVKSVSKGTVTHTLDRNTTWLAQTPQVFKRELILQAHKLAVSQQIQATDDSVLVENLNHPVFVVKGQYHNFKITTPADFELAKLILQQKE